LRAAATASLAGDDDLLETIVNAGPSQLQWALDAGLGPMMHRLVRESQGRVPQSLADVLLSAELTARVRHGTRVEAALDVLDICSAVGAPAILLKGISISEQCYPRPHERAMTDIDVLVPEHAGPTVESEAVKRGYERGPPIMGPNSHHGEPLVHPTLRTKIEIHTALFQLDSRLRVGNLFDPDSVRRQSVPSVFHGRPVLRLSTELQLAYIASYWVNNLSDQPMQQSYLAPLLDAVTLLRTADPGIDWDRLLALLDNELAIAALDVLLSYLCRQQLVAVPDHVLLALRQRQQIVGATERGILLAMIDRYLVGGQRFGWFNSWHLWRNLLEPGPHSKKLLTLPWRIAFPPAYPDRFQTKAQLGRLRRWITGNVRRLRNRRRYTIKL
jgi:hypothetical protein